MERRMRPWIVYLSLSAILLMATATTEESDTATTVEAAASNFVKKTISSHQIVIFSKSYFLHCKRVKRVFKQLNQTPFAVELNEKDDGLMIQLVLVELFHRWTIPRVFIDGKHIEGSDDTIEAYGSGGLAKLLRIIENDDAEL